MERIVGGSTTPIAHFPWQLSLRYNRQHICGASSLTVRRGLTAAHCLNPEIPIHRYFVVAGTASRQGNHNGFRNLIGNIVIHPGYQPSIPGFRNNLAVLYFIHQMPLSRNIRPIAIPAPNAPVPFGATAIISGW